MSVRFFFQRCSESDLKPSHPTTCGIRAQENQKFEKQRLKPNWPRNKSAQNRYLSIPMCFTCRKECNSEKITQIGAPERPHAPPEVGEYPHAPSTRSLTSGASTTRASHLLHPFCRSDPKSVPKSDPKTRPEIRPEIRSVDPVP